MTREGSNRGWREQEGLDLEVHPPGTGRGRGGPERPAHSRRRLAVLLLLGLLGVLAWEVGATLQQHATAPGEASFKAAAEKLRGERQAEEPVLFAPPWMDPLGRLHFGPQVPFELMLLSDVDRFARVWQVSVRGHRHPWLASLKPARSLEVGGVRMDLFEKPAEEVLFDFTANLERAVVQKVGDQVHTCPRVDQRFACDPRAGWNSVKRHLAEVGHRPYRCIYAHPVEGHLMKVRFPAVPLGKRLVGYTGIDDFENRKRSTAPVLLTIRVGGRAALQLAHQNHWPWYRFVVDTSAEAGQSAEVSFEVSAEKAYARAFCFAAEARR